MTVGIPHGAKLAGLIVTLWLTTSEARAAQETAVGPSRTHFLGWSQTESVAAFRREVRTQNKKGGHDTYTLATLVRVGSQEILGTWRLTPITRVDSSGQMVSAPQATLAAEHADYQHARPHTEWQRLARKARFFCRRYAFKDSTIRLRAAQETHLTVSMKKRALHFSAEVEEPLVYDAIVRLMNGDLMPLGHFAEPARPKTALSGTFAVYHSRSGRQLLALADAFDASGRVLDQDVRLVSFPTSPFGMNEIGAARSYHEIGVQVRDLFGDLHPKAKKIWDEQVGEFF